MGPPAVPWSCFTVSGEIGSGKSSVARLLADRTGSEYHSTGGLQRRLAAQRQLSTLEMNLLSESEPKIDRQIDGFTKELAATGRRLVIDSRLAWNFVPQALKVFLLVETDKAARRVMEDEPSRVDTESYEGSEDAVRNILARQESERRRFLRTYGVDLFRWSNYDLVIDTTEISPERAVDLILGHAGDSPGTRLWLGPRSLYPTRPLPGPADSDPEGLLETMRASGFDERRALEIVATLDRGFYVLDGHERLSCALRLGLRVVPCELVGQDRDEVAPGVTVAALLEEKIDRALLGAWEDAHGFRFRSYPPSRAERSLASRES